MLSDQAMLDQLIAQVKAEAFRERLLPHVRPSLRLTLTAAADEEALPLGAMKFGGRPDLPPGVAWPSADDVALHFVGQLRLDQLAPHDPTGLLPKSGLLSFFFRDNFDAQGIMQLSDQAIDTLRQQMKRMMEEFQQQNPGLPIDETLIQWAQQITSADFAAPPMPEVSLPQHISDFWRCAVLYYEGDYDALQRVDPPDSLPMNLVFRPCTVTLGRDLTIPPIFSYEAYTHLGVTWEDDPTNDDPYGPYIDLLAAVEELDGNDYVNRMFGYPDVIQGDVYAEAVSIVSGVDSFDTHAAYDDPDSGITDWLLLLQVDSDDAADFLWGDAGLLYWCIRRDDLAAGRFDRAVCTSQYT